MRHIMLQVFIKHNTCPLGLPVNDIVDTVHRVKCLVIDKLRKICHLLQDIEYNYRVL